MGFIECKYIYKGFIKKMENPTDEKVMIAAQIPKSLKDIIDLRAKETDRTASYVIREALKAYFQGGAE